MFQCARAGLAAVDRYQDLHLRGPPNIGCNSTLSPRRRMRPTGRPRVGHPVPACPGRAWLCVGSAMAIDPTAKKLACGLALTLSLATVAAHAAPEAGARIRLAVIGDSDSHAYHDRLRFSG